MTGPDKKPKPKTKPKKKPETKQDNKVTTGFDADVASMKEKTKLIYFDAAKREVKSLNEILETTTEPQEIFIPELGCLIKVGHLTMEDVSILTASVADKTELSHEMLYRLLKSADDSVTIEAVKKLPFHIMTAIINVVTTDATLGFQQVLRQQKLPTDT